MNDKLVFRMNSPRVVIDNAVCATATVVKVDCARKHGILLEAVQVLTDLNLSIRKAYISSDGRWFMDVYHVTDLNGEKVTDKSILNSIEESLSTIHYVRSTGFDGLTALELTGTDRVGLLSEIFAVLSNLQCNVVDAKVWTHNGRAASLIYIKDFDTSSPIEDHQKIAQIELRLKNVLKGDGNDTKIARTSVSLGVTHTERRLHQMMFDDRDFECRPVLNRGFDSPIVTVQNWTKRVYSVINVQCRDRTKLLFDVVCTLTDMDYIVFHATIYTSEQQAYLEFYIRHKDGTPISSEPKKQRVIQCLKAAIERRETQGIRLDQLCTGDRKALLAEITRTFRENGLNVSKAEISTTAEEKTARNLFYVTDAAGNPADLKIVQNVCEKIGLSELRVAKSSSASEEKTMDCDEKGEALLVSIGSLVKRFMRSYS